MPYGTGFSCNGCFVQSVQDLSQVPSGKVRVASPLSMVVNDSDLMIDAASKSLGIGRIVEPMIREALSSG